MKVNNTLTKISKYFFTGKLLSKQMETPLQRLEWIYNHFDTNASDIERRYKDLDPLGKFTKQSLYNIEKGDTKSITVRNAEVLKEVFPELNMVWLTTGLGNKLTENRNAESETLIKFNPTLTDVNKRLKEVIGKKTDEGFIPDNVGLVKCFTTVIPISGQAGLHQVMYDSEYISQKFERVAIMVPPAERGEFIDLGVAGDSMFPTLHHDDRVRCKDVQRMTWRDASTFKSDRIYCFWHNKRRIIYKRVKSYINGIFTLTSDNDNKAEFPDFKIDVDECSRILLVTELVSRKKL